MWRDQRTAPPDDKRFRTGAVITNNTQLFEVIEVEGSLVRMRDVSTNGHYSAEVARVLDVYVLVREAPVCPDSLDSPL